MTAEVRFLFAAAQRHGEMLALPAVQVHAGAGIVGDRFYGRRKAAPGRNLTLIAEEDIAAVNAALGLAIAPDGPRRNVVTRGIDLNTLVGRRFRVGEVLLEGIEACTPCVVLGRHLKTPHVPAHALIRAFANRGGLRAAVLGNGILRVGDPLSCL